MEVYRQHSIGAIRSGQLDRIAVFTVTDNAEKDDHTAKFDPKSLLFMVSIAFEDRLRKPFFGQSDGEPLLGMEKFVARLTGEELPSDWVLSPNATPSGERSASRATSHGAFDDDAATLKATLARILGVKGSEAEFTHHRSASSNLAVRRDLTREGGS
jgi:hypothetical protein